MISVLLTITVAAAILASATPGEYSSLAPMIPLSVLMFYELVSLSGSLYQNILFTLEVLPKLDKEE